MKKTSNPMKGLLKTLVNAAADPEPREWPPKCTSFLYQPKRPATSMQHTEMKAESK